MNNKERNIVKLKYALTYIQSTMLTCKIIRVFNS
jgi:hypothetical protein